ncbi:arginine deiminase-related protein [Arcanobacterium hippocoleae]|uniref:Amidinotransferase n=1 Tax=Arcanobacterium hippocoleae TaxID=149017 RepID=A0ABU1T0D8_9ACTO|nr:arginine deiminase-related protein [Arcanobacterium hippocoleae]MDR6938828.1 hypothetical protein [Arcanobacterium hippocoleae]
MVRPAMFNYNCETSIDNAFQQPISQNETETAENLAEKLQESALAEFNDLADTLRKLGVRVEILFDSISPYTPDSIFPNNWFSTHEGTLILYPMMAKNRQLEVTKFAPDLIEIYQPQQTLDFTSYTRDGIALESTGAMIFDRRNGRIYASLSNRCNADLLQKVAATLDYEAISFRSQHLGMPIYHTNVLLSLGTDIALIGTSLIDIENRHTVIENLVADREIVELSPQQITKFAGNMLELRGADGPFLLMSSTAYSSLETSQISQIEKYLPICSVNVATIEKLGGGSVRCMVGEIFSQMHHE